MWDVPNVALGWLSGSWTWQACVQKLTQPGTWRDHHAQAFSINWLSFKKIYFLLLVTNTRVRLVRYHYHHCIGKFVIIFLNNRSITFGWHRFNHNNANCPFFPFDLSDFFFLSRRHELTIYNWPVGRGGENGSVLISLDSRLETVSRDCSLACSVLRLLLQSRGCLVIDFCYSY